MRMSLMLFTAVVSLITISVAGVTSPTSDLQNTAIIYGDESDMVLDPSDGKQVYTDPTTGSVLRMANFGTITFLAPTAMDADQFVDITISVPNDKPFTDLAGVVNPAAAGVLTIIPAPPLGGVESARFTSDLDFIGNVDISFSALNTRSQPLTTSTPLSIIVSEAVAKSLVATAGIPQDQ